MSNVSSVTGQSISLTENHSVLNVTGSWTTSRVLHTSAHGARRELSYEKHLNSKWMDNGGKKN